MAPKFISFVENKTQLLSAISSSTGVNDANKIVATDETGRINQTLLGADMATEKTLASIDRAFSEKGDLRLETGYLKVAATTELTSFAGFYFDDGAALWLTKNAVNGTVTHIPAARSFKLTIGAGANDTITRQTLRVFPYFSGNVQSLSFGLLWTLQDGANLEVGYGDDNNGIFFLIGKTGGVHNISLVKRSDASGSVVTDIIPQASWNIDKLDGTGISGITLDLTKGQMFVIDWTWQGFGSIDWSFRINGRNHLIHRLQGGNNLTQPLLGEPNQPLRYRFFNNGVATAGSSYIQVAGIDLRSAGVDSTERSSFARSTPFPVTSKSLATNTTFVLMSLRPKIIHKSRNNRGQIKLSKIWISGTGSGIWAIVYNPTLTGAAFVNVDANNSFCEYDVTATGAGGSAIYSGAFAAGNPTEFIVPQTTDAIAPFSDFSATNTVSLLFRTTAASVVQFGFNWEEFI